MARMQGLDALSRKLRLLPKQVQNKQVKRSLSAGARELITAIKAAAPEDTGLMKTQIVQFRVPQQNKVQVGISSRLKRLKSERTRQKADARNKYRPANYGAYYWRFVEFGTSRMPAKPFIRPTFDAKKTGIARRIIVELEKGIETEARKL
ncbi:HK97-gp10 family putative phage morphogenesis protein [Jeongeupia naejangsanensis]|uniref:HK97 gp10 family phage protein n=1 Tax=Jeongeupia naejangsanensis TaxID=613195 RepID=A0ABS2BG12_9NEIS|nr:HK97-gp10 family putative phage morphogenesis protein [Jeongeupia naejangsanensis]MBM3114553.1 HK97 gp10 family phage protein [Jeongeupia naejangsanensis]